MRTREAIQTDIRAALARRHDQTVTISDIRARVDAGDVTVTADVVRSEIDARNETDVQLDRLYAERDAPAGGGTTTEVRFTGPAQGYDAQLRAGERSSSYHAGREGVSFFRDMYLSQVRGDFEAQDRLRLSNQMELSAARSRGDSWLKRRDAGQGMGERATTTSSFAGLVPPQYLVDETALVLRNGRPTLSLLRRRPLPETGMSIIIPRGTTGATAAVQATEGATVSQTDQVFGNLTVPVITIAGSQVVSRQSLERGTPDIDALIFADLVGAYAAAQDVQAISGTGTSGQALGALNTSGINASVAYGAALTATNQNLLTAKIAGQVNAITSAGTVLTPTAVVMHPRRWAGLEGATDSTGRPLATPLNLMPSNGALAGILAPGAGSADSQLPGELVAVPVGVLQSGMLVYTDANLPTTAGANSVEDILLVLDTRQHIYWEDGDGMPRQLTFEPTLATTLQVTLVTYGYSAVTFGRYPLAVGKVGGVDPTAANGQISPSWIA